VPHLDAIKRVGENVAIMGKAPVLAKVKGLDHQEHKGEVVFYEQNQVKNHDFIWAAWTDYSTKALGANGEVPEQFMKDTAKTLKLIKNLL